MIRILTSDYRIRIQEAQKDMDPDSQDWSAECRVPYIR